MANKNQLLKLEPRVGIVPGEAGRMRCPFGACLLKEAREQGQGTSDLPQEQHVKQLV